MTTAQLSKRVAYWCGQLQLDPWTVSVSIVDDPHGQGLGESNAAVGTAAHYLYAEVEFATEWARADLSQHERDVTIVHELLHCLFRDIDKAVESVSHLAGMSVFSVFNDRYNHELEQLIDRLARVIVTLHDK